MRSARMLLATAAASAVLAITAPGAFADGDKWNHEDNAYSKEHHKDSRHDHPRGGVHTGGGALTLTTNESEWDSGQNAKEESGGYKEHGKESEGGYGKQDAEGYKDHGQGEESWKGKEGEESWKGKEGKESWKGEENKESWKGDHEKGSWKDEHDKPQGGMHTGGGALASPAVTAGGLAVLAVAGSGVYALRRKKSAGSLA